MWLLRKQRSREEYREIERPLAGRTLFRGFALLILLLAFAIGEGHPASAQGGSPLANKTWVRLGGPLGGLGYDIRMPPDNPDVMYVTDSFAGLHKSTDGGLTWFPINEGIDVRAGPSGDAIPVFSVTVDPNDPDVVWAGTQSAGKVYRSVDGGRTWEERINGILEGQGLSIRGITIEQGNSDVIYAAGEIASWVWAGRERTFSNSDMTRGVVYKSTDAGLHWEAVWRGDNLARYVWIDPRDHDTLYVSTGIFDREAANSDPETGIPGGVGVLKSTDGGKTWFQVNEGLGSLYVGSLFMHPRNPDILLAGAAKNEYAGGGGIYLTTDGGAHWQYVGGREVTSVEFALSDPGIAYAGGDGEFYRSEDGGLTWRRVPPEGPWGPRGIRTGFPIDFQVDPRDPYRIFANNYGGGNFLSEDGGQTWVSASTGYTGAGVSGLAMDAQNAAHLFATGSAGPFRSMDGGRSWEGLNPGNTPGFWMIALDPANTAHVLTAMSEGVVYESMDGGLHWEIILDIMSEITEQHLVGKMDLFQGLWALEFSPSDPSKVYAGFANGNCASLGDPAPCRESILVSMATSEDGGHTWTRRTGTPFEGFSVMSVIAHPTTPDVVWVATAAQGIFQTSDGGTTWEKLPTVNDVESERRLRTLVADPSEPDTLYAGTAGGGAFKSEDGGMTWQMSRAGMDANEMIETIVIDPVRPNVVYAGSKLSGAYLSEDAGATWRKINDGLRTRSIRSLVISADGETLYAATRGEGVFRMSTHDQSYFDALAQVEDPTASPQLPLATATDASPATSPSAAPTPSQPSPIAETPPGGIPCLGGAPLLVLAGLLWLRRRRT